jgi:DNA-directed RNA polymerase subunit RPC12/RpoP
MVFTQNQQLLLGGENAMSHDLSNMRGLLYECVRCGHVFDGEELDLRGRIACPECGYRVLKKTRGAIVRRVKAV